MTNIFEKPKSAEVERSSEQMETIRKFEEQENTLIEGALNRAKESGHKKTSFKSLAAFLALFTASTMSERAFAESAPAEKLIPETQVEEVYESKKDAASSSWDKLASQINIIFSQKQETIKTPMLGKDNFYQQLSFKDWHETVTQLDKIIRQSANAREFFQKLSSAKNLSDTQKILALSNMGGWLSRTYNFDMNARDEYVVISDEKMFENMKLYYETGKIEPTGICGNIHVFMVKAAEQMGMDAWLQSGIIGKDRAETHIWMGTTAEDASGNKQIVFLDYGNLIPTGTRNYSDALGITERFHGRLNTLNSFVGTPDKTLFPVESRAEKVVKEASGFKGAEKGLSKQLETGTTIRPEELNIEVGKETKKIELSKDHLALAYIDYQDAGNPYQSLKEMQALRGSWRLGNKRLGLDWDTTILNLNIKDLGSGVLAQNEIINRLNADFINSHELSKSGYGKFVLNYGLTLETGLRFIGLELSKDALKAASAEGSAGVRLIYVDPKETLKFFIETTESGRMQISDPQEQRKTLKEVGNKLKIGQALEVRPGTIINFESALHNLEYGKKEEAEIGWKSDRITAKLGSEVVESEYKKFIPSSEKISAEIGYKIGAENQPKGEVVIFGSQLKEHYEGQDEPDKYEIGVKMRIFLW
ncbi:MAG: hypothetical protein HZC14_00760 [Candidatus Niyogibacteria bacterium]|nr:hypothetical protein [Candidatus Niyogibacteria bacterium]